MKGEFITKVCPHCGQAFQVEAKKGYAQRLYCSDVCCSRAMARCKRRAAVKQYLSGANWQEYDEKCKCCGVIFHVRILKKTKRKKKYCDDCRTAIKRDRMTDYWGEFGKKVYSNKIWADRNSPAGYTPRAPGAFWYV